MQVALASVDGMQKNILLCLMLSFWVTYTKIMDEKVFELENSSLSKSLKLSLLFYWYGVHYNVASRGWLALAVILNSVVHSSHLRLW